MVTMVDDQQIGNTQIWKRPAAALEKTNHTHLPSVFKNIFVQTGLPLDRRVPCADSRYQPWLGAQLITGVETQ